MTASEIFSRIASHIIEGIMVHEQLMNSYLFMGLPGYATCHEYHYLSESIGYSAFCEYVVDHFDVLIVGDNAPQNPGLIPNSWMNAKRTSVNQQIRHEALEAAFNEWLKWEEETITLYSDMYKELIKLNLIPASEFIKKYIMDAEEEAVYARDELISKEAMNYDIVSIVEEQKNIKKQFKKKIINIGGKRYNDKH